MSFVVDASVSLAWCFEAEHTPPLLALLDRVVEAGAVAPALWPLEATNGLLSAERRGRVAATARRTLADFLHALPITVDMEAPDRAWAEIDALATRFGLTSYDAAYLELAQRRRLPLATMDAALRRAADALDLAVLPA